jgi:hypothetical protein
MAAEEGGTTEGSLRRREHEAATRTGRTRWRRSFQFVPRQGYARWKKGF